MLTNGRRFQLGAFCMVLLGIGWGMNAASPNIHRPDIFLVTIDTLRSDHLGCYGYEKIQTPAIDGLAKQGIRFADAFTPSPITNTSHVTILTGLLPSSHGVTDFGVPLETSHTTLAELLRHQGYQTAAFIGSVILDSKSLAPGLNRGFDFYDNFPENSETKSRWGRIERRGMDVVERAEKWLNAHRSGTRFVWVHLYDPHDPYEPPAPYSETYKERLYDGEIAYADSALGHLLSYLKANGWFDEAEIIVVGDHGEGLGEHQEETHGIFLYDSTTHVPLIMKRAGNADAGRVVTAQVRTLDILPTLLELLEVPTPANVDGSSLLALISGADNANRMALGETDYPLRFGWAPLRSVRANDFKFIEAPRPELYDLHSDPGEERNRYEPWNAVVQAARQTLAATKAKSMSQPKPSAGAVGSKTIAELRALGYLGAADAGSSTNVPEPSLLPDPKDKIPEQNLLHAAMMASEDGQIVTAKATLQKLLRLDRDSVLALSQIGELEAQSGNYKAARDYFRRAHEVRPDDSRLAMDYGRALIMTRDFEAARGVLEQSLNANPKQPEAQILLGTVYFRLNRHSLAMDQVASAVLSDPGNTKVITAAAKTLIDEREFQPALDMLEPIAGSANNPELLQLMARAYRGLGRLRDAQRSELQASKARMKTD